MTSLRVLALAAALAAGGCASLQGDFDAHLQSPAEPVRDCAQWYRAVDQAVDEAGVPDAQYRRVNGFPYFRVDRPLSALRERAGRSEAALQAYAERMLELDLEARRHELENLPRASVDALPGMGRDLTRGYALRRTRECGRLLREIDLAKPQARGALLALSTVQDDYSSGLRAVGLYWLIRLPFASGVRRWEKEMLAAFRGEAPAGGSVTRVRYAPPAVATLSREMVAGILDRARFDPLGQPSLTDREFYAIATTYAPSFDVAIAADYDRFGVMRWLRDAEAPAVDASEPAVYVQPAYTRYAGQVLLQMVYTIWFAERPAQGSIDILAGRLDGIVWRVTLAPDGEPLLYDSMHPCGCFHQFFPTPLARPREAPDRLEEWAFIAQALPRIEHGQRPVVSIASGTHYIDRVTLVRGQDSVVRYAFYPYDELRSLPRLDGGKRSAFGPDGLVAGTQRTERFFYWPMGIASAGAMRQWGRHATAFVGRRHFDDADLIERRFKLAIPERAQ